MEESRIKRILRSRFVVFLLLLIFIWSSISLVKIIYRKHQLGKEIDNLKAELEKTQQRGQEISQLLQYFGSQDYVEQQAKEKLNLKKEGESVVMIPEAAINQEVQSQAASLANSAVSSSLVNESNLIKWWNFFFKK